MSCLQGYQLLKDAVNNQDSVETTTCASPDRLKTDAFELPVKENNVPDFREDVIFFIIEEKVFIPVNFWQRWSRAAFAVAILTIATTMSISISSFVASRQTSSSAIFSCAFDALLEAFSTLVVIWRFNDSDTDNAGKNKERLATLIIAITFLLTGTATLTASVIHFCFKDHPNKTDQLVVLLIFSSVAHITLSNSFYYISKRLHSSSLRAEAVDNALAAATSLGILISTVIYRSFQGLWWLDHSVAILLGVVSLLYGVKLIVVDVEQCGVVPWGKKNKKMNTLDVEKVAILSHLEQI